MLAVFSIAGRLHTGGALERDRWVAAAWSLAVAAAAIRTLAAFSFPGLGPGSLHLVASLVWAGAFLSWLYRFWPWLSEVVRADGGSSPSERDRALGKPPRVKTQISSATPGLYTGCIFRTPRTRPRNSQQE